MNDPGLQDRIQDAGQSVDATHDGPLDGTQEEEAEKEYLDPRYLPQCVLYPETFTEKAKPMVVCKCSMSTHSRNIWPDRQRVQYLCIKHVLARDHYTWR